MSETPKSHSIPIERDFKCVHAWLVENGSFPRTPLDALKRIEEQLEASREAHLTWEATARANGDDYRALREQLATTQAALRGVIQHVEDSFQGGTFVDPVFVIARKILNSNPASSPEDVVCKCGGKEAGDINFDRSICACGAMHYYCNRCGWPCEPCDESNEATGSSDA